MTFPLNNREFATFIWLALFIIVLIATPSIRKSTGGLLKSVFSKHILIPILLMAVYVAINVFLLYKVHFWDKGLIKDTIVWFVGAGLVMLFNTHSALKNPLHIKEIIKENIKLIIVLEFVINLYIFSLPIELILVPMTTFLVLLQLVSKMDKKHTSVTKIVSFILGIIGLIIIGYTCYKSITDFNNFASFQNLQSFLFPILLTAIYIPFLYAIIVFMFYEEFFVVINSAFRHRKLLAKHAKREIWNKAGFSLSKVRLLRNNLKVFSINTKKELNEAIERTLIHKIPYT